MEEVCRALTIHSIPTSALTAQRREDDPHAGRIFGLLPLGDGAIFALSETIDTHRGFDARLSYSYRVMADGRNLWGWDRDTRKPGDLVDHEHINGDDDVRAPKSVTLSHALKLAWDMLSARTATTRQ